MLIWDNHSCMPLRADTRFMPGLERYGRQGVDVVSLNVAFDLMELDAGFEVLDSMREWIDNHPRFALAGTLQDIERNKAEGRTTLVFDVEGLKSIGDRLDLLRRYHALGVRWASPVYNRANQFGGGCLDTQDQGLSPLGCDLVRTMNALGMVVCASHTSRRTSLELVDASEHPVIFSHSNAHAVHAHPRNIVDEQIKACAARGGVIGINGLGFFVGGHGALPDRFVRHICHVADLVGVEHVGVALDYVFDPEEVAQFIAAHPAMFPATDSSAALEMMPPECFGTLPDQLMQCGMTAREVDLVMGGNWERIARIAWA